METARQQWGSKLGFILAASGSAIGLGNIVFFGANAYKYGAGAFYVPYLVALFAVGLPLMILEFGLGREKRSSFPMALGKIGGKWGEAAGWWGTINTLFITMYYVTILGWVTGMWWQALIGQLWQPSVAVPAFGLAQGDLPNPLASFFNMLSGWGNVFFVLLVWAMNILMVLWGVKSIEAAVRVFVPLMWLFMIALIVRGLTLPGGIHGVYLLFTPKFEVMANPEVWHGAFTQIFFTLSLGFGIMTTYASYLPRKSDLTASAISVSTMNCAFEMIAGLAIFSLLFVFALTPKASTISMMFFIIPSGIAALPFWVTAFGVIFFTLLLLAGLTSSISLIEAMAAAIEDKFGLRRGPTLVAVSLLGIIGSVGFALPLVIDKGLNGDGTLGLTLLDLVDHYAFGYGLLITGLIECLLIGWLLPVRKLRETINATSSIKLGAWFDYLIKYCMPLILAGIIGFGLYTELRDNLLKDGLYGAGLVKGVWSSLPLICLLVWLLGTSIGALVLSTMRGKGHAGEIKL